MVVGVKVGNRTSNGDSTIISLLIQMGGKLVEQIKNGQHMRKMFAKPRALTPRLVF